MLLCYIMIIMIIWHLITVENPLLFFCPGLFLVALMTAFTFSKLTIGVKFASLHPLNTSVVLSRRFNHINNYWLDFIISWCSKLLKEQINFFLKPGHDLTVNKQSPVVMSLYYSTLVSYCDNCLWNSFFPHWQKSTLMAGEVRMAGGLQ